MEKIFIGMIALIVLLLVASNYLSGTNITIVTPVTTTTLPHATTTTLPFEPIVIPTTGEKTTIKVPAVDNEGRGVVTLLTVQTTPGEGRVLVDINQLLFWVDTQYSIRIAETVAENITGTDLSNTDLIYGIETNASLIGGESAGAALTIATVAAIENKTVNPDVMITGTIDLDGTIGPIGGVVAKAKAAKDVGAELFLVPEGQAAQTYYVPEKKCEEIGPIYYCRTEYKVERIDVSAESGIAVEEVANINEALEYFIED